MAKFGAIGRVRTSTAMLYAALVAVTLLSSVAVVSSSPRSVVAGPPPAWPQPAVSSVRALPAHFSPTHDQASRTVVPSGVSWPTAARVSLPVTAAAPGKDMGPASRAPGVPVSLRAMASGPGGTAPPSTVDVRVLGHSAALAAGVNGVVFTLTGVGSGSVRVGLDYSGFASVFGGGYGSRLRLVQLGGCVTAGSALVDCRRMTALPSANSASTRTVSTSVSLAGAGPRTVVMAAVTGPGTEGGSAGTYAATDLKPSGSWTAGGSSGSFDYTVPVPVPPASSSLTPKVALAYDSGSVDGQTAATQAQASWVGDGWSTPRSFVEQTFAACSDNPEGSPSPVSTSDMCYAGPILTLSLNGSTTSLVWDATQSVFKLQNDNGAVVSHVTNSNNGTGTYNSDYWQVTTRDGTVYQFGRNRLPGWVTGKPTTNSVDSEPVFSAHSGDPCYNQAGFASSVCTMAYRWNLDYVKDTHNNAMAYYYLQDTNYYGEDLGAHNVAYVRDSHLDHVDYGLVDPNAYATAPDRMQFSTGDRCVSGTCQPLNATNAPNWPDVPFDLICAAGATCASYGPAFFSTVRLTAIATQQWSVATSTYVTVDSYALVQTIPPTGDGTPPTLWLSSVTRTGSDTTAGGSTAPITLPPVTFAGIQLQNRVDTVTDGLPALWKYRITSITTETGSVISPTYSLANPCSAPVTTNPATNTSSCYPVRWTPTNYAAPITDWFNKYVVTKVVATDPTGGAPALTTTYSYLGGAAWHFDDNEVVQAKYRSYAQFRGYGDVQARNGDAVNDPQTLAETTYYRGMSQDNNTTVVNLSDSAGGQHEDLNQLAGRELETTGYLGDGGPVDHSGITSYWVSAATATRTRTATGLAPLTANWVAPVQTYARQAVTSTTPTTWRYTQTDTSYDASTSSATFGLVTHTYRHTVPVNAAYDTCTSLSYAPVNASANLVGLTAETETDSVACGGFTEGTPGSVPASVNTLTAPAGVNRPAQVVSDVRTFYDDPTWSTTFPQTSAPSKGDDTMVRKAVDYTAGAFTYQTTGRSAYDSYGRQVDAYNANGNDTRTGYTMNSVGLVTAMSLTNPLGQATSSTIDPLRGSTLTATDTNGVVTTEQYDALGRLTSVWLNSRATTAAANYKYSYVIANNGTTSSTTQKLNEAQGYTTSTLIYDALLRRRQTQIFAPPTRTSPQPGRLVSDTFYDSRGWVSHRNDAWWDPATTPNGTLVAPTGLNPPSQLPSQSVYTYDGLGRVVVDNSERNNQIVSTTTTVYNGDRTTTIPPTGATVTSTVLDLVGRTAELDQYTSAPTLNTPANTFTGVFTVTGGGTQAVTYGYDGHGNQAMVVQGAGGPTWSTSYDLLGRVTAKSDPDAGSVTGMLYDGDGNLTQQTDARGLTVSYTYDLLDRRTGKYLSTVAGQTAGPTGTQLGAWFYDNSNNAVVGMPNPKGHLTTSVSYSGGNTYTKQQKGFNLFGESTGVTITIPSAEGNLSGSYTFSQLYTANTGLALKDIYPLAGGLPGETVLHNYTTQLDLPNGLNGLAGYAQATSYDAWGRVEQQTIGTGTTNLAYLTNRYDDHTGRLTDQLLTRAVATPTNVDEEAYTYDLSGNITKQVSTRLGSSATSETRCHVYNALDQLAGSWTATDGCATAPTGANTTMVGDGLGTSSAYWTSWTLDPLGDRSAQVKHAFSGGPASDISTSYTYGTAGAQPHTLTATATTGGATGSTAYTYDASGNMATRNAGQGSQTFTVNNAGQLTAINGGTGGNSGFVYDADGNLLLQKDPGTTVLYLGTEQLSLNTTTGAVTGARYYQLPGSGAVVRTGSGTSYMYAIGDHHSSPVLYLDSTVQVPTWRQYTPYGEPRGATVSAPDNHGFLDKPTDTNTGLTVVGARQYDPTVGRFVTDDPVLETTDPSQLNGYGYAGNNPNTHADPTGNKIYDPELDAEMRAAAKTYGGGRTIAGVTNTETGKTTVSVNGKRYRDPETGKWQSTDCRECAEPQGMRQLGLDPNDPADRAKVELQRPYQGSLKEDGTAGEPEFKDVCDTCQGKWTEDQFAPGTQGSKGPNGQPGKWERDRAAASLAADADEGGAALSRGATALKWAGRVGKGLGAVGLVAAVGYDIYDVAEAPPGERVERAVHDGGELVGGLAGAAIGAEDGAVIGAIVGGPVGAVVGGVVGGIVGGVIGSGLGAAAGDALNDAGNAIADFFGW
jgi:RHS repeat-associated protein